MVIFWGANASMFGVNVTGWRPLSGKHLVLGKQLWLREPVIYWLEDKWFSLHVQLSLGKMLNPLLTDLRCSIRVLIWYLVMQKTWYSDYIGPYVFSFSNICCVAIYLRSALLSSDQLVFVFAVFQTYVFETYLLL